MLMRVIGTFIFLLALGQSIAQKGTPECPAAAAVTIDGQVEDWPMNWINDEEKVFSYNVCTDENNLYLRVSTRDYYAKRKMAAFGFTLWMDPSGKKKKKFGLRFPVGGAEAEERAAAIKSEETPGNSIGEQADFQKKIDRKLIADLEVIELIGLADEPITSTRSGITNGIKVAISVDADGAYVYEALIPFKSYRLSKPSMSVLSIGFETGKYVVPKQKTTAKDGAMQDYNPSQLSRMQGYEGVRGNPKLTYTTFAWTTLKFK